MLTITQAAERLGLSRQRIHVLIKEGRIRAEQAGKIWLITPEEVRKFKRKPRNGGRPKNV
jgi:excisionase family DNA binding protein